MGIIKQSNPNLNTKCQADLNLTGNFYTASLANFKNDIVLVNP